MFIFVFSYKNLENVKYTFTFTSKLNQSVYETMRFSITLSNLEESINLKINGIKSIVDYVCIS